MLALQVIFLLLIGSNIASYCEEKVRYTINFELDNVFGMWFGVNYAQHTPDLTDRPGEVGCITLYIVDVTHEELEDWVGFDGTMQRRNWTNPKWRSRNHNPWSNIPLSGSWLDYPIRNKRSYYKNNQQSNNKRIRVVWDEDGQTEEQTYVVAEEMLGFWRLEQWRLGEREMLSRGLDVWYPNEPSLRVEYIYIIQSTPEYLTLYHCSKHNGGRAFSLVLRRSPTPYYMTDWLKTQRLMVHHEMPIAVRHAAICGGCRFREEFVLNCLVVLLFEYILW